jgi:hypothetical protein
MTIEHLKAQLTESLNAVNSADYEGSAAARSGAAPEQHRAGRRSAGRGPKFE